MKIGFVGLGKLGLPVALAWEWHGHEIVGYDVSPEAKKIVETRQYPHREAGAQKLLEKSSIRVLDSVSEVVEHSDLVFVAVQTPHGPEYEGVTRMPEERADFDYRFLKAAVAEIAEYAEDQKKHVTLVVVSTVLPGTSEREILPLLVVKENAVAALALGGEPDSYVSYVYSPLFVAMGTVVADATAPEFVLLGVDKSDARGIEEVKAFFLSMHSPEKLRFMSVASAELCKVAYNVALSVKITIANSLMEIAHKTGANVDDVTDALGKATDRIISPKYLRGGMPDSGPCHPRDLIALAWLAEVLDLSYDFFGSMVHAREGQASFLAELCEEVSDDFKMMIVVLGKAYKKGTNLTIGSSATLLKNLLDEAHESSSRTNEPFNIVQWDPHVDPPRTFPDAAVFIVATDHDEFYSMTFPKGSTVIDPWGKMTDQEGVRVIRVGRTQRLRGEGF